MGNDEVANYCRSADMDILLQIPHDRAIAEGYSQGHMILRDTPQYRENLLTLFQRISNRIIA
jgi:MinD superfamily P-loop ATPase